jgi:Beta-L-arabinofuranosidase, GH127/Ricin-type beta-trefoil lectin domain-like
MPIQRRTFLKGGLMAAGGLALSGGGLLVPPAAAAATGAQYPVNAAPLTPNAYLRLPPGAVTPSGWLATQLDHQVNGLNGRYEQVSHFLVFDNTGWVNNSLTGWEEVPYWLRGYGDLGYVTGDATVQAETQKWIEAVLATGASDGFFGPAGLRTSLNSHPDFWPHMPMLHALRSWAEYHHDDRIAPFLTKFFHFMAQQTTAVFTDGWGNTRWGDTIDVIYWLYNQTGDSTLIDLVRTIQQHSANWMSNIASLHNVNFAQGFREGTQYSVLSGSATDRNAAYANYNTMMAMYGQYPGGGFAGDENARPGYWDPRQGFETCGIVEFMGSHEILTRITGDAQWADRAEQLAFNMLPAALDPLGKVTHYVTSANSVWIDNTVRTAAEFDNGFAMQAYLAGVDQYRCCPHNYGQGWPYFTEEMWLATPDGGLVASLLGPSSVTAAVSGGGTVTIAEQTEYPFSDTITFTVSGLAAPTAFPFGVRIPGWCAAPALAVNGSAVAVSGGPRYATVNRTWSNGDTVTLRLPMAVTTRTWPATGNAVSVTYGPLTMSLDIGETWTQFAGTSDWPEYQVTPSTAWNYGLPASPQFTVSTGGNVTDPFTQANAPVRISATAQQIPQWTMDGQNVVAPLETGPVAGSGTTTVTLVPMGAARLRITAFPQVGGATPWGGNGVAYRVQNKNSGKVLAVDQMSTADSARVVQFTDSGSPDHLWRLIDNGDQRYRVINANSGKVLGVSGMSTADSAQVVQFADSGTADHLWQFVDNGDGWFRLQNVNSGKVLGVDQMSTADSANVVQFGDTGTADHLWRVIPDGTVRIENVNSRKVLGVDGMSTADSAHIVQFGDNGTPDHDWQFVPDANGYFRIRNVNSGKVLGVDQMSTANSAQVVQFTDNGTNDHLWRLLPGRPTAWRIENLNSGKVLGVDLMSLADSGRVVQFDDNGTADHLWRFL